MRNILIIALAFLLLLSLLGCNIDAREDYTSKSSTEIPVERPAPRTLEDIYNEYIYIRNNYLRDIKWLYISFSNSHEITHEFLNQASDIKGMFERMEILYRCAQSYDQNADKFVFMQRDIENHELGHFIFFISRQSSFSPRGDNGIIHVQYQKDILKLNYEDDPPGLVYANFQQEEKNSFEIIDPNEAACLMFGDVNSELYIFLIQ